MSDGERSLQQSVGDGSISGSLYDMRGSFSESTSSASSGGNGYLASTSSSSAASSCSASFPNSSTTSAFTTSQSSTLTPTIKCAEESLPSASKRDENLHNLDITIDTFHTPSTSLQNLSGPSSSKFNGSSAGRRLSDVQDDSQQNGGTQHQHQSEEEEYDAVTDSGTASTSIPVTITEIPDSPQTDKKEGANNTSSTSPGMNRDDQMLTNQTNAGESSNNPNKSSHLHQHKRQNSAGSQCSLSSNPENSQFKTADAHSSDSDASRNSGTTSGFAFDNCSESGGGGGESSTIKKKDEPDQRSLQSDHSYSGEHLNTSVESVDLVFLHEGNEKSKRDIAALGYPHSRGLGKSPGGGSSIVSSSQLAGSSKPRVKKKMWYQQIFSTSYKTRSGDFKKIFKDLPTKERLIVDYSCALQKEILLQGRMYVSQNYVSFYANIFGWETQISVSFKEIESITKEKTALIIPNAIQISTMTEKFFFSSFVTRDTTYVMLFKLWQSALLEDSMSKKDIWKLVHTCYGEELGVTSEDESEEMFGPPLVATSSVSKLMTTSEVDGVKTIEMDPEEEETKNSSPGKATPEITVDKCDDDQENEDADDEEPRIGSLEWCRVRGPSAFSGLVCAGEIGPAIAVGLNIGSSIVTSNGIPIPITSDPLLLKDANIVSVPVLPMTENTDSSDTEALLDTDLRRELQTIPIAVPPTTLDAGGESPIPEDPPICPVDHNVGKEMLNVNVACSIDQLFTMLFTNSTFYLDFQLSRKTCDMNQSDWQLGDRSQKTRQLSFTVMTGQSLGPKTAQVTETQTLLPESRPGLLYAIQSESVNAGIPYADAFAVNCHYCLTRVSPTESNMTVISKIHYKKSTWAKTFIEKNSMSALGEFFSGLEKALREECAKMNAGGVTPTSPIVASLPRRRHHRKKCRAPDIPVTALPRPIVETTIVHPVGSRPSIPSVVPEAMSEPVFEVTENTLAMKIILTVLGCLLLLNAFLYFKLTSLETAANMSSIYPATIQFSGEVPQTHQEWLLLLQQQETLHRTEVQSWHEILASAIKVLHQAEKDLENLKTHISTYGRNTIVAKPVIPAQDSLDLLSSIKSHNNAKGESISPDKVGLDSLDRLHSDNDSNNNNVAEMD